MNLEMAGKNATLVSTILEVAAENREADRADLEMRHKNRVAADKNRVAADKNRVAADKNRVAADKNRVTPGIPVGYADMVTVAVTIK